MKRPLYLGEESIAHRLGGQIKITEDFFFPGSLLGPHLYCFPPLISTSGYLGNRKKWVLDLLPQCKGEPQLNSGRSLTVGLTDGLLRAVLWAAGVMIGTLVSFTDSGFEVLNFSVTGMGSLRLALN